MLGGGPVEMGVIQALGARGLDVSMGKLIDQGVIDEKDTIL